MGKGAWRATVHRAAKSQTCLKGLSTKNSIHSLPLRGFALTNILLLCCQKKRALSHSGPSQAALVVENLSENAATPEMTGKFHGQRSLVGLQSMRSQKVRRDYAHTSHNEWFFIPLFFFPYMAKFSWIQIFL